MLNQFANEDNWKAHKTDWSRDMNDTHGTVTHFVAAMGTTGTMGTFYLPERTKFRCTNSWCATE
jgi:cysteine synthase B